MIKFGTGGWRAIIADEFTKENIRCIGHEKGDTKPSLKLKG